MTEEQEKQESQKTLVAFVAGLLIGGLLVWVFGGAPEHKDHDHMEGEHEEEMMEDGENMEDSENEGDSENEAGEESSNDTPVMQTGDGEVDVADQPAGMSVALNGATFPTSDGWIGVRSFPNGQIGSILGAARYSESQGLIPTEVELLVPTVAGRTYAVTFFSEDGDRTFNPAYDVQLDTEITTFTAQ